MNLTKTILNIVAGGGLLLMLTACNGVLDDIYDAPPTPAAGNLYVDASSWTQWYYIDLHAIQTAVSRGEQPDLSFTTYDIPLTDVGTFDADGTGIYTYWYDVFGEGLSHYEFRSRYATARQPEPEHWDLAVHRQNVRTNGGAVVETSLTDLSQVGNSSLYASLNFVADEWNETDVWTVQDKMLLGLIGNQRIKVNNVLGNWLRMSIPPIPPVFTMNSHVFIVRFSDGTYAALRLKNYIGPTNVKCCLTIEYKYPI